MSNLASVILAVIQGITEFIPVSSAGFVKSVAFLSGADAVNAEALSVILHMATTVAAIFFFRKLLFDLLNEAKNSISDVITGRFSLKFSSMSEIRKMFLMLLLSSFVTVLVLPLIFKNPFVSLDKGRFLLFGGIGFLLSGFIIFFSNSGFLKVNKSDITPVSAILIGLAQCFSMIVPGFSRLAVTTALGSLFGVSNQKSLRYSIILNIPFSLIQGFSMINLINGTQAIISVNQLLISFVCCLILSFFSILLITLSFNEKFFKMFGLINTLLGISATVGGVIIVL